MILNNNHKIRVNNLKELAKNPFFSIANDILKPKMVFHTYFQAGDLLKCNHDDVLYIVDDNGSFRRVDKLKDQGKLPEDVIARGPFKNQLGKTLGFAF